MVFVEGEGLRREEKRTKLLPGREDDPRRVELRRQDLSRIFHSHPGESGDGGGQQRSLGGPRILGADEAHNDDQPNHYSHHHPEYETHPLLPSAETTPLPFAVLPCSHSSAQR